MSTRVKTGQTGQTGHNELKTVKIGINSSDLSILCSHQAFEAIEASKAFEALIQPFCRYYQAQHAEDKNESIFTSMPKITKNDCNYV